SRRGAYKSWIGRIAMSVSFRRMAGLALAGLAVLAVMAASAQAQRTGPRPPLGFQTPPPFIAPPVSRGQLRPFGTYYPSIWAVDQTARNISVLGAAYSTVPPYALGYNPYPSPIITSGPVVSAATLSTSPYALSTAPIGYGGGYNP